MQGVKEITTDVGKELAVNVGTISLVCSNYVSKDVFQHRMCKYYKEEIMEEVEKHPNV